TSAPHNHDCTHLPARQNGDAIGHRQDQGMGARLRTRAAMRGRAADGLDGLHRHAPAAATALRHGRGGRRLLRASWHSLPAGWRQSAGPPGNLLFRQFRLQAPRGLDALTVRLARYWATACSTNMSAISRAATPANHRPVLISLLVGFMT